MGLRLHRTIGQATNTILSETSKGHASSRTMWASESPNIKTSRKRLTPNKRDCSTQTNIIRPRMIKNPVPGTITSMISTRRLSNGSTSNTTGNTANISKRATTSTKPPHKRPETKENYKNKKKNTRIEKK